MSLTSKISLRNDLKQRLSRMSQDERERQSKIINQKVVNSEMFKNSQRVSVYLSMKEEVGTQEILKSIFQFGKECFIPKYDKEKMEMLKLFSMKDFEDLPLTKWNIKQPSDDMKREEALNSGGLDLIIVPGLGFTKEGGRLGRGKGYYDAYLKACKESGKLPITLAIAFSEQIVDHIPLAPHDVNVDYIFHPDS